MSFRFGRRSLIAATLATAACGKPPTDVAVGDDCQIAREAERKGDYRTARSAFATCLQREPGFIDSHLSYQRILELEDGIEGARKIYAELARDNPGVMTSFALARILPQGDRATALERIAASNPDFAPVYYELGNDVSDRVMGLQSLAAKRKEKLYLQQFLDRAKGPDFVKWFADYALAESWIRDAQARMAKLGAISAFTADPPLTMTASPSSAGWMITFAASELHTGMEYRVGDEKDFKPFESYFTLPLAADVVPIAVRYRDPSGAWQGPFDFTLEPRKALITFGKSVLAKMPSIWVALGEGDNAKWLYFTTAMVYRCAIDRLEYGLDTATPDREFTLPPCDPRDPMAIPDGTLPMIEIDPAVDFVSVRLTFADGERTEVHRIERRR